MTRAGADTAARWAAPGITSRRAPEMPRAIVSAVVGRSGRIVRASEHQRGRRDRGQACPLVHCRDRHAAGRVAAWICLLEPGPERIDDAGRLRGVLGREPPAGDRSGDRCHPVRANPVGAVEPARRRAAGRPTCRPGRARRSGLARAPRATCRSCRRARCRSSPPGRCPASPAVRATPAPRPAMVYGPGAAADPP